MVFTLGSEFIQDSFYKRKKHVYQGVTVLGKYYIIPLVDEISGNLNCLHENDIVTPSSKMSSSVCLIGGNVVENYLVGCWITYHTVTCLEG